jgi:hypothetical protein
LIRESTRLSQLSLKSQQAKQRAGLAAPLLVGCVWDCHDVRPLCLKPKLDYGSKKVDHCRMEVTGRVQNGAVVFDAGMSLPEGAQVTVSLRIGPKVYVAKNQKRVEFPLVRSSAPGSVHLTNAMIGEILDEEDASS